MKYSCPKCLYLENKPVRKSVFLEFKCVNCGFVWFENYKVDSRNISTSNHSSSEGTDD